MTTNSDIAEIPSRARGGDWQVALWSARTGFRLACQTPDAGRQTDLFRRFEAIGLSRSDANVLTEAADILERFEKSER